jgi:hypothetical protein
MTRADKRALDSVQMTDWMHRSFTLGDLVKAGIYIFINHRLKQYYIGGTKTCFGSRFLREIGKRQGGESNVGGYDLVFEEPDTEIVFAKSFIWIERYRDNFDLDALEGKIFREYRRRYPNYLSLNRRRVKKWSQSLRSHTRQWSEPTG